MNEATNQLLLVSPKRDILVIIIAHKRMQPNTKLVTVRYLRCKAFSMEMAYALLILMIPTIFFLYQLWEFILPGDNATQKSRVCNQVTYCEDALAIGSQGRWVLKESNGTEGKETWDQPSVFEIRKKLGLPYRMTRDDFRCGISYPIPHSRLPAQCDAESEYYCCVEENGWCGNSNHHCRHQLSVDYKEKLPTKDVYWSPGHEACNLREFSVKGACQILSRSVRKIVFVGDSQARTLFTSLIMFLSNDYIQGVLKNDVQDATNNECTGEYQLLNNVCKRYIFTTSRHVLTCDGNLKTTIEYVSDYYTFATEKIRKLINKLSKISDSYVVLSLGTHFNADHKTFIEHYLQKSVGASRNKWPKFIVEDLPAVYSKKASMKREEFNDAILTYAATKTNMEVLKNFNLSKNLQSHDGRQFGLKFNMLKVNILLHHFYNLNKC